MPSDFNKIYLTDFSRRNALRQCHLKKYIKYNPRTGFFDLNNEKAEEIANIVAGASE